MATHFGSDGKVKLITTGGTPAAVGELLNWTVTMTADAVETTSMGDTARTYTAGLQTGTGSMSLYLDPADAVQEDLAQGDVIDAEFYAEGDTTGDQYYSGSFIVTSVERGATLDGIATLNAELQLTGALTIGTVA
jgi:predicted secreted protein